MVGLHDEIGKLEAAVEALEGAVERLAASAGHGAPDANGLGSEEDEAERAAIEQRLDRAILRLEAALNA